MPTAGWLTRSARAAGCGLAALICCTHYAANLTAVCPKNAWTWVRALLHSVYEQPDAESVHAQFDHVLAALTDKLSKVAEQLEAARADVLAFTTFPKEVWRQIWSNNPTSGSTARSAGAPTSSASFPTATP